MNKICFSIIILSVLSFETQVQAQLFGERAVGKSLKSPSLKGIGGGKSIDRTKTVTDFIGQDSGDSGGFVGSQQTSNSGRVRNTTETIRRRRRVRVNRPIRPSSSNSMYDPKLSISNSDFDLKKDRFSNSDLSPEDSGSQSLLFSLSRFGNVQLKMDGTQATIHGTVSSAREKRIAGYLVSFEPGIDSVKNHLTVQKVR